MRFYIQAFLLLAAVCPVYAESLLEITLSQTPYRAIEIIKQDEQTKNYYVLFTRIDVIQKDPIQYDKFENTLWVDCNRRIYKPVVSLINGKAFVNKTTWQVPQADDSLETKLWFRRVCP